MDKFSKKNDGVNILVIKNNIILYKSFLLLFMFLSMFILIMGLVLQGELHLIMIYFFISLVLFCVWLFCERLVYLFKLPSNRIIVDDETLRFIHRKKIVEFKISEITIEFHSFFEDFESLPTITIKCKTQQLSIMMEKRQFVQLKDYLDNKAK